MAVVSEERPKIWSSILASYWMPPFTIFESPKKFDQQIKWGCWYRVPSLIHTRWHPSKTCKWDSSVNRTYPSLIRYHPCSMRMWKLQSRFSVQTCIYGPLCRLPTANAFFQKSSSYCMGADRYFSSCICKGRQHSARRKGIAQHPVVLCCDPRGSQYFWRLVL